MLGGQIILNTVEQAYEGKLALHVLRHEIAEWLDVISLIYTIYLVFLIWFWRWPENKFTNL